MSAGVVRLDNVTLGYERRPAVHHLSGAIGPAGALAVCGPNGAGKSTLLKGLAGLLKPIGGRILREGLTLRDISYLPQAAEIDLSFPIDVFDFVASGATRRIGFFGGVDRREEERAIAAIAAVGLEGFEDRQIGALSGGQTQRALFARLIVEDRPVVLLDEPFGAIDASTIDDLVKIIARWREERRSVVAVLHELELARRVFPQTLLLAREPIFWGPTREALSEERLAEASRMIEAFDREAQECRRDETDHAA
ncbi:MULTISPECIES: metal ABC transporter ATP-binding protein [Methylosinus]|uniref:Metal ABC transporter ATP-binding protein n=1 Tax=Methylosinus trichosporium (strain ATCC 35070 / NCIMB 11131 / UNIQEM 75 / OB3b) TaxID=595536 RepID=A0A2D2D0P7_METT3|nr:MULTISPECIES: metal ABC transporter ATP-binding protein [Methylosinus]ATQ68567.1 metal ABC transporter ATP-binding protein [Methylosinus trichosporium OB3b]OBS52779.1 ABC transporter [Methylosinus sp. 3S-1]